MKYLFLLLFLSSCVRGASKVEAQSDLLKFEDTKNNVTCYRFASLRGISCLKNDKYEK